VAKINTKIGNKDVEIRELTAKEIRVILQSFDDEKKEGTKGIMEKLEDIVPLVSNLKMLELEDFTPSELEEIWGHVQKVNSSFFGLMEKAGVLAKIKASLSKILIESFSSL